jgi:hypothetical protein
MQASSLPASGLPMVASQAPRQPARLRDRFSACRRPLGLNRSPECGRRPRRRSHCRIRAGQDPSLADRACFPEVTQRNTFGVAQPRPADRESPRARSEQETLLDLPVAGAKLVDRHVRLARAPVRVLGDGGECAGGHDFRDGNPADGVRHLYAVFGTEAQEELRLTARKSELCG